MINSGVKARIDFRPERVRKAARSASGKVLARQGAFVRGAIRRKIRRVNNPNKKSAPGLSPFTHDGTLKKSIMFAVDNAADTVLVGAGYNWIGAVANLHEFGGTAKRRVSAGWNPNRVWSTKRNKHADKYVIGDIGRVSLHRYKFDPHPFAHRDPLHNTPTKALMLTSQKMVDHANRLHRRQALAARTSKMVNYPARPFIRPGFNDVKNKLPSLWANSIKETR